MRGPGIHGGNQDKFSKMKLRVLPAEGSSHHRGGAAVGGSEQVEGRDSNCLEKFQNAFRNCAQAAIELRGAIGKTCP